MADPLSLTTGIISLITLAIKLVAGAAGLIDKTVAAHHEAANELQRLQQDLEQLEDQMDEIHGTLQFLAANTKDRAFKNLLQDEYGKVSIRRLCTALDETFAALERLTERTEAEKTNLQSIALPTNVKSLEYVQAVLKYSFSRSKVGDLVTGLRGMQSEIRACLEKLEGSYQHLNDLYSFANNRLVRVVSSTSVVSTSTMLSARIKLAGWLKRREGTWGLSIRRRPTTLNEFLDTDDLNGTPRVPPGVPGDTPIETEEEPRPSSLLAHLNAATRNTILMPKDTYAGDDVDDVDYEGDVNRPAVARYSFEGNGEGELPLKYGRGVTVLNDRDPRWWYARDEETLKEGVVPAAYLI